MTGARLLKRGMIVAGSRTSDGVIVTIPANSMFNGQVFLTGSQALAGTARPRVTVVGVDCDPADQTVVHQLSMSGLALTTITTGYAVDVLVKTGASPATLNLTVDGASSASASVNGFLV